jgi:hypothetical protein
MIGNNFPLSGTPNVTNQIVRLALENDEDYFGKYILYASSVRLISSLCLSLEH